MKITYVIDRIHIEASRAQSLAMVLTCVSPMSDAFGKHGAEQYTGYLEFIFSGYHLDRTVPRIPEPVHCLVPSLIYNRERMQEKW